MFITCLCSLLGFLKESLCSFWEWLNKTCITCLVVEEILIRSVTLFGCQGKWILSFCLKFRIEAKEIPVTFLHLILAVVHTTLSDTVELTWSISDDQRWTVISLCLCNRFDSLGRICAESDLSNVYICLLYTSDAADD